MDSKSYVLYDGRLIREKKAVLPLNSRGLMYGDGCFETMRTYEGKFFRLEEHLGRLQSAAQFLDLDYPEELRVRSARKLLGQLLKKNGFQDEDALVRVQLWRKGGRGYHYTDSNRNEKENCHFAALASPLPDISESVRLATVDVRRIPDASLPSSFKLSNNLNYIMAAREAARKGADDALMLTVDGHVSETTIANIFWVRDRTVYTPSAKCDLLPGITRNIVMKLIGGVEGFDLKEGIYEPKHLHDAEAAWVCNSVREVVPVHGLDETTFSLDHSLLKELSAQYRSLVIEEAE